MELQYLVSLADLLHFRPAQGPGGFIRSISVRNRLIALAFPHARPEHEIGTCIVTFSPLASPTSVLNHKR